jgi:hypothetical protein
MHPPKQVNPSSHRDTITFMESIMGSPTTGRDRPYPTNALSDRRKRMMARLLPLWCRDQWYTSLKVDCFSRVLIAKPLIVFHNLVVQIRISYSSGEGKSSDGHCNKGQFGKRFFQCAFLIWGLISMLCTDSSGFPEMAPMTITLIHLILQYSKKRAAFRASHLHSYFSYI